MHLVLAPLLAGVVLVEAGKIAIVALVERLVADGFQIALADRVVIVQQGRLEQAGTPGEILDEPASEFVARFIGDVNVLDATNEGGVAAVGALSLLRGMSDAAALPNG